MKESHAHGTKANICQNEEAQNSAKLKILILFRPFYY